MDYQDLTPAQQAEAHRIEDLLLAKMKVEARQIACLLASKPDSQLLGQTEFQLRDRLHSLGAQAVDAALSERKKTATGDAP